MGRQMVTGEVLSSTQQPIPNIMRTPRSVALDITSQCNLRCLYCYYFSSPTSTHQDLPTDEWLRFFDELGRCAVMQVLLQGGEPFMRKDLPTIVKGITSNRMRFVILTNGMLIDDDIASFIASTGRCDQVRVSVDGSCPDTHDACRGSGSFDSAIRGIRVLQRHGVKLAVRVTVHRKNVHDLENIACLLLEDLGLPSFDTNAALYLGSCRQNSAEVMLTVQEWQVAMKTLLHLSKKYDGRISTTAGPLFQATRWRAMEQARLREAPPFADGGFLTGCVCVFNNLAVHSNGVIVPCTLLSHIKLGRINRDSFMEVWQDALGLERVRQRFAIPLNEFDFCAGCSYIPYCTGNCSGPAYATTGKVDHPNPHACLRRFLENGGEIV